MFYRIMTAPPRYLPEQKYMVGAYGTLQFESAAAYLTTRNGSNFFATLEAAREALPAAARRLPYQPEYQFVELWEALLPGVEESDGGDPSPPEGP